MSQASVATPYARALLEVAIDRKLLPAIRREMAALTKLVETSSDLRVVLANPTITETERARVVEELGRRLNLTRELLHFLLILSQKRRLARFLDVAREFERQADVHDGLVRAEVRASVALDAPQRVKLSKALEQATGRRVVLECIVDPSLIGGMRVKVDGRVYDASLRTQLEQLRASIRPA